MVTLPADSDQVLQALRLGWYVADVRDRSRPDDPNARVGNEAAAHGSRTSLRSERDTEELRIESQAVLEELAVEARRRTVRDGPQRTVTTEVAE